ncbi:nitrate regulatory protein [Marinospirillum alkaliphilum]|uniref:ANTAR domain-containing protein n=1 Tax=Marinospirillum alkaliphilum DSM 21637 TaxID=1122209 RepID=A0A1K1W550_9GAMM|nr:nitrate regulatory protein [Marinospirillum alkaliphilum]SFX31941.1 ANTAR domain-containing protein [Marinospirillum alkaliphilum DSM 21637]
MPTAPYPSAQQFLLAARQCEIQGLEQLAQTCELVGHVSRLVHELQRERGLSNVFLASQGCRYAQQRAEQVQECLQPEQELRRFFASLNLKQCQMSGHVRQFSRIAAVLQGLDALPELRRSVIEQHLTAAQATQAFIQLIGSLLAVVFEAADASADPDLTRLLVAMFNFMQGKELAGQERAWGARGFAAGHFELEDQQGLQLLIEGQERCFELFADFTAAEALGLWQQLLTDKPHEELLKLRQVVSRSQADQQVPSAFSEVWYDVATARIDAMKIIEDQLAETLKTRSEERIQLARRELKNQQQLLQQLDLQSRLTEPPPSFWVEGQLTGVGRSLCELVQAQSQRLQQMQDELQAARQALNERKLIEKAKGLLMQHRQLTEEQAWRQLRQAAMEQNRRLVDVAERVIGLIGLLQVNNKDAGSNNAQ